MNIVLLYVWVKFIMIHTFFSKRIRAYLRVLPVFLVCVLLVVDSN